MVVLLGQLTMQLTARFGGYVDGATGATPMLFLLCFHGQSVILIWRKYFLSRQTQKHGYNGE